MCFLFVIWYWAPRPGMESIWQEIPQLHPDPPPVSMRFLLLPADLPPSAAAAAESLRRTSARWVTHGNRTPVALRARSHSAKGPPGRPPCHHIPETWMGYPKNIGDKWRYNLPMDLDVSENGRYMDIPQKSWQFELGIHNKPMRSWCDFSVFLQTNPDFWNRICSGGAKTHAQALWSVHSYTITMQQTTKNSIEDHTPSSVSYASSMPDMLKPWS